MSESAIIKVVTLAMKRLVDEGKVRLTNDLSRVQKVRFSGLPFCGVRWFYNLPMSTAKVIHKDFAFSFFTSVGTTVHTVIQNTFLSVEDVELLMDWKCTKCGYLHVLVNDRPTECPECGNDDHTHEEHTIEFRGALGHIDQLIKFVWNNKTWIVVIDYKTTTLFATRKRGKLPYKSNVSQIKGYCGALNEYLREKGWKARVMGWALVYVPRDNPFEFQVHAGTMTEKQLDTEVRWIESFVDTHGQWMKVQNLGHAKELSLERPCAKKLHPRFEGCELEGRCAGDQVGCNSLLNETFKKVGSRLPIKLLKKE